MKRRTEGQTSKAWRLGLAIVGDVYRYERNGRWFVDFLVQWENRSTSPACTDPSHGRDAVDVLQDGRELTQSIRLEGGPVAAGGTRAQRMLYYQFTPMTPPGRVTVRYRHGDTVLASHQVATVPLRDDGLQIRVAGRGTTHVEPGPHPVGDEGIIRYQIEVNNPHPEPRLFDPFRLRCAWVGQETGHHDSSGCNGVQVIGAGQAQAWPMACYYDLRQPAPRSVKVRYGAEELGQVSLTAE